MSVKRSFDLEERLIEFCAQITGVVQDLPTTRVGNYVGTHLTNAAFSSAFNYAESQSAESRKDFVHKLKIVLKELRESLMALKIIYRLRLFKSEELLHATIQESNELIAIFFKSIDTARHNARSDH